jgi:hypothetical protein
MNTVHLTDAELELTRHALHAYLQAFGHGEADTVAEIRHVLEKFRDPDHETEEPHFIG